MKLRALVAAFFALVVAIVVTPGCAEPERGIVLWHPYKGGEATAVLEVVARFEAERGLHVTTLSVPYEAYLSKLEAAIPRANGPDFFIGPHNQIGEYRLHRLVGPVGDAFPPEDDATYEASSVLAVTEDGVRYAVPLASKCAALYYDTRIFPEPPASLEEIEAKTKTLPPGVWPLVYEAQSVYYHAGFLHAYGGKLFDPTPAPGQSRFAMVGPGADKSLDEVRKLVTEHAVPDEASGDLVKQLFASGKAAAAFSGPWLASDLAASKVPNGPRWAVAPLPTITGVGPMRPYLTVDGVFMTPDGAKSEAARALARAFGGLASAKVRAEVGKQIVSTKAYWDSASAKDDAVANAFRRASADAIPMPAAMDFNPIWEPAKEALRKTLRGDVSAKEATEEARARYEDVMRPAVKPSSSAPILLVLGFALLAASFAIVKRVRAPGFGRELRRGATAYRYVTHAAVTILVLVVFPLLAGAAMSFFTGTREDARFVGLSNYIEILTARGKPLLSHGSFYLTLLVTVVWTILNVALHVGIGLVLGIALAGPIKRLRAVYRVLLILPWAVPSYVTALAWKGMFHAQFGAVNAVLVAVGAAPINWWSKFSTAFAANVATNVWLGFPFMMVVVMGALTSISKDVLEAAEVDGATRWQTFRLVTLPLLRPTLLPAVVLGSVWTFNNFNVVYLVSGGEPDGTTDTLVSEAYRWAFARNSQLGYAAAYAVVIFGLLALMSRATTRIAGEKKAGA